MAKTQIPAGYIAANAITATEIAANSITAAAIASDAIVVADIADNSITSAKIAADAVGSSEIATLTGTLSFGDNVKAVFGAGSDLEIYSDGNNSILNEVSSTGSLLLQGSHTRIKTGSGVETMAEFIANGAVTLYYDNSAKLATTSAGITVTGNASISSTYPKLSFVDTDNNPDFTIIGGSGQFGIYDETNAAYRFQIDSSGNITVSGTVDGRDLATDGTKLDGIEASADVTDTANVTAAGALMDSELTDISSVKALNQGVATSDSPTFVNTTLTGYLAGPATFTIDPAAVGDNTGTVVIAGNLQVDGTTTTINSTTMTVDDLNIVLASGAANAAAANGAGITVDTANATITYNATNDDWNINKPLKVSFSGDDGIQSVSSDSHASIYVDSAASYSQYIRMTENGTSNYWIQADSSGKLNFRPAGSSSETTKVVFDSAGNVGIGTYSPSVQLHVKSSTSTYAQARIDTGADGYDASVAYAQAGTIKGISGYDDSTDTVALKYGTFGGSGIDIDSSGNVGIGTTSPINTLSLDATTPSIDFIASGTSKASILSGSGGNLAFYTGGAYTDSGSERMRIDTSGNLLVGTIDTSVWNNSTGEGVVIQENAIQVARSGNVPLLINRQTSDGELVRLLKDGSTVGTIGTSSDQLYIGYDDTGIRFTATADDIRPWNPSTGAIRDAAIDLGDSAGRFKDLYLSNGVDLNRADGGTQVQIAMKQAGTLKSQLTSNFGDSKFYLYHSGGNRVVVDSSGNVGIGTSSPTQKLDVNGNIEVGYNSASSHSIRKNFATSHAAGNQGAELNFGITDGSFSGIRVVNTASTVTNYNSQYIRFDTHRGAVSAAERMRITDDGKVGIGTSSPQNTLHVSSTAASSNGIRISNSEGSFETRVDDGAFYLYDVDDARIPFYIDTSGNAGIGTTSPYSGTGVTSLTVNATSYPVLALQGGGTNYGILLGTSGYLNISTSGSRDIVFSPNDVETMRIKTNGKVLIGDQLNFSNREDSSFINGDDGTGHLSMYCDNTFQVYNYNGGWVRHLALGDTGDLVIGGSTGSVSRAIIVDPVNDTGASRGFRLRTGTNNATAHAGTFWECHDGTNGELGIKMGSNLYFYMANNGVMSGDFNDTSDRNLKENITTITETGGLPIVTQLNPVIFDWRDQSKGDGHAGFIAQEVEEILPNDVSGQDWYEGLDDEDKPGKSINVTAIVAHAVKAIQQLKEENDSLKARIEALET